MQNVIEKIKKLLALSKSDNAHEAATAAGLAQKLMTEHSIAAAELGGESEETAQKEVDALFEGKSVPGWLNMLAAGLCKQNNVHPWIENRGVCIAGRPSDVANVRFLFAYLRSEIERLTQKECRGMGRSIMTSYRKGAACGAIEAMQKATEAVRATATGSALVKVDSRIAEARTAAALGKTRKASRVSVADGDAFRAGLAAGSHLHGSTQIAGRGARLLGAG